MPLGLCCRPRFTNVIERFPWDVGEIWYWNLGDGEGRLCPTVEEAE